MGLSYRLLKEDEYQLAPREVVGSDGFNPGNSMILAAINEQGEVVSTWTVFAAVHLEPFWVREDYRGSMSIMRRMAQNMRKVLKDQGILACYSVVMESTPVLAKFAKFFGGKPVDGTLYYWVAPKE